MSRMAGRWSREALLHGALGFGVGLASAGAIVLIWKQLRSRCTSSTPRRSVNNAVEDVLKGRATPEILKAVRDGTLSVNDLMGPLHGVSNGRMPEVQLVVPANASAHQPAPTAPEDEPEPMDQHNTTLLSHVHPREFKNPEPLECYDLVVIGAGVGGLLSVIMAHQLGLKCALIEKRHMGGDCLNVGCFPSKAVLHCARVAHEVRNAYKSGVIVPREQITVDFGAVMKRMRALRAGISPHDGVERYARDFCEHVFVGHAAFDSANTVKVSGACHNHGDVTLRFRKAMVCTGTSAVIPPVPGLASSPHITNNNFFNLTELPPRVAVIGAGPIGLELAQALQRLGAQCTVLERAPQVLIREDPDAAACVAEALHEDGVLFHLSCNVKQIQMVKDGCITHSPWPLYKIEIETKAGVTLELEADAVLNAAGRAPNVHGMGLDVVGVEYSTRRGVHVNDYCQTSNPDIYACGDVASMFRFTHNADWQARVAIRNMFVDAQTKCSDLLVPWCTYTDPEIAHVGLYEKEIVEKKIPHVTYRRDLKDVDRCKCDGVLAGFVKISVRKGSEEILGATIVGPRAGDMISEITVCMQNGVGLRQLAGTIHPYPTANEAVRQCAGKVAADFFPDRIKAAREALVRERYTNKIKK